MVERRPRRAGPVWAWAVGLIVLLLLIWLAVNLFTGREEIVREGDTPAGAEVLDGASTGEADGGAQ